MSDPEVGKELGRTGDPLEDFMFKPLRESLRLGPVEWLNFTRLVALHVSLDRMLSLRLTVGLTSGTGAATAQPGTVEKIAEVVAHLTFDRRITIGETAGWVKPEVAAHLREVNRVRNRLLHFDPRRHGFEHVPEIADVERFKAIAARGWAAQQGLLDEQMMALFEAASESDHGAPA